MQSLQELREEKFRLQREILKAELNIKTNYKDIVDALTFRNVINTIAEEIIATNFVVSQAYSIIRPLFKLKKKKKIRKEPVMVEKPKPRARKSIRKKEETKTRVILKEDGPVIKNEG